MGSVLEDGLPNDAVIAEPGFSYEESDQPRAFIQFKGTHICMDFYCECGADCHFDGYFAHVVQCPHCLTKWEMPWMVFPRKAEPGLTYHIDNAQMMEPDEDLEPT
jgi:hypothetical protein